jgi:hypothetical protein
MEIEKQETNEEREQGIDVKGYSFIQLYVSFGSVGWKPRFGMTATNQWRSIPLVQMITVKHVSYGLILSEHSSPLRGNVAITPSLHSSPPQKIEP